MTVRNRKIRIIETSIEKLVRILPEKWGIKVVFKPDRCETTGKTIYLPVIPDDAPDELLHVMQGRVDHECAHCAETAMPTMQKFKNRPKAITMLNAFEDPRVELLWIKRYPGARLNLERLHEYTLKHVVEPAEVPDGKGGVKVERPWDRLTDFGKYITASLTQAYMGEDHWFMKQVEPAILDRVRKTSDLFEKAKVVASTEDLPDLVEEALKRLQETDDPTSTQPQGNDQDDDDQDQEDDQDTSAVSADDEDGEGDDTDGSSPQQQAMVKPDEDKKPAKSKAGKQSAKSIEQDQKITDPATYIKQDAKNSFTGKDAYLVYTTEGDRIEKMPEGKRKDYVAFMQDAVRIVAPMKRRLSRALMARKVSHWEEGKKRGKINGRRVYKVVLATGSDVFRQRVEGEQFDTAVLLAVDHSGSMGGKKLELASQASVIFGELFNQIGIPFACYGFSTGRNSVAIERKTKAPDDACGVFTRWGDLWLGEYKSFSDSWMKAGPKMLDMCAHGKENTYDGESLRRCAQILLQRPERRKILFWLNDGEPCPNGPDDLQAHVDYAKLCASSVEKLVEVIAIGIMTDSVKDFYKYWVRVSNLSDLPKACLSEIDSRLRLTKKTSKIAT